MSERAPFLGVKLEGQQRDLAPLATTVSIEDNDRLVDEARCTFKDPDGNGSALFANGRKLKIDLGWRGEHAILFEGVIVESRPEAGANTRSVTVVARDLSHLMCQETVTETHPEGTLETIVKRIAARNGYSGDNAIVLCDPNPELTERSDRTQHRKTDYQHLQDLAQRYGARAFVEYNDGASRFFWVSNRKLLEIEPLGTLQYCRGINKLIEFRYESAAARSARQVVASAVDPATGEVRTTTTPASPPPADGSTLPAAAPRPTHAVGQPSDPGRAERATIFDPTRVLGLRGTGRAVGTIMLRAKGKVEITGIAPWAEGSWYIAKATHSWRDTSTAELRRASYETSFTATR